MRHRSARTATRQFAAPHPALLLFLLLSLLPLAVHAQDSTASVAERSPKARGIDRNGFYLSFGFGGGEQRFRSDLGNGASQSASQDGAGAMLRLGWVVSPRWLLSADIVGFSPDNATANEGTAGLFATTTYLPRARGGLLLRGGIGMLYNEVDAAPGIIFTNRDAAIQLGVGYDFKVDRDRAISLSADLFQGFKSDGDSQRLALIGVAFNLY